MQQNTTDYYRKLNVDFKRLKTLLNVFYSHNVGLMLTQRLHKYVTMLA